MAVQKLSQITAAPSSPGPSDTLVGVSGANVDQRYSLGQIQNSLLSGINVQTASYVLALGDSFQTVEMNAAGANNLTVPTNASVPFAIGTKIIISQIGAGNTTIVAAGGVTIRSLGGVLALAGQYAVVELYKRGTDEWVLWG
jgi:hypothetical protein